MPKRQLVIFVVVDFILAAAVIFAAFRHVRIVYVMTAFIVLSVINGVLLIVTVVRNTGNRT